MKDVDVVVQVGSPSDLPQLMDVGSLSLSNLTH